MYDFAPLRRALAKCRAQKMAVPIWWRDDDAVEVTAALERLFALSDTLHVPVHLAVIPAYADPNLASVVQPSDARVLVHGWSHENRAPSGEKKAEFGHPHANAERLLEDGKARLIDLFPDHFLPIFVPPWNRFYDAHALSLADLGYQALSTFGPRSAPDLHGVTRINTHVDPIFWRGHRDLVDPDTLIAETARILDARLAGDVDATEPMGFLTHHLVHTDAIWTFTEAWFLEMLEGGATPVHLEGY